MVFDEQHFGLGASGTVVGLARRYRLTGMAFGLALCAALFIWKNSASFPPPAAAVHREALAGRTSLSGLYTLLRRHIKPADLAATCWNEWLVGNGRNLSPERRARAKLSSAIADANRSTLCAKSKPFYMRKDRFESRQFQAATENVLAGIRKVIIGQDEAIRYSLVVVLCNQHALIEGVPGLARRCWPRTLAALPRRRFQAHPIHARPDAPPTSQAPTSSISGATNSRL
ncbi:MAG: hypothetical protein WDO73_02350 [Ignavibacteriota bacterium]